MTLARWEPLRELRRMERELDRMWEGFFRRPGQAGRGREETMVPVDMYETKDHFVVKADLPGVRTEDVEVTITGNQITIHGEVKDEQYYLAERMAGTLTRTVTLPSGLDTDRAEASFDNGTMTVRIPKREEAKPKSVKVRPGQAEATRARGGA